MWRQSRRSAGGARGRAEVNARLWFAGRSVDVLWRWFACLVVNADRPVQSRLQEFIRHTSKKKRKFWRRKRHILATIFVCAQSFGDGKFEIEIFGDVFGDENRESGDFFYP